MAKKLRLSTIQKEVEKTCRDSQIELEDWQIERVAQQLKDINDIISRHAKQRIDRTLFAICEKEPRNLGSGNHYFSVRYIKNNQIEKLWLWDFISALGGITQNRDRSLDKFVFGSGIIGMSRVLDATDGVFNYLKAIGGFYHRIECL